MAAASSRRVAPVRADADEFVETQRAEHFAVAGRAEIHRQLSRQLGVRGITGVQRHRHPHREARRVAAGRGGRGVDCRPNLRDAGAATQG